MTCSEDRLVAFLAGDLSKDEARQFDEHLLTCEACWRSVQDDRAARLALSHLREPAPDGLADRIALLVEISSDRQPEVARQRTEASAGVRHLLDWPRKHKEMRQPRRWLPAAIGAVAAAGLAIGLTLATGGSSPAMPGQIAAVAAAAASMSTASTVPAERQITVASETMSLHFYVVDHLVVTVATARRPFPMVASSDLERGSSQKSWLATMGGLGAFCMNHDRNGESMLMVAKMPAAELPAVALRLHLI
jgi:Putative zinc-finger